MKKQTSKAAMLAALSAFQMTAISANATEVSRFIVAENASKKAICDIAKLDRDKTINGWVGLGSEAQGNEQILSGIDSVFATTNYFDTYPEKLPELFQAGACDVINK